MRFFFSFLQRIKIRIIIQSPREVLKLWEGCSVDLYIRKHYSPTKFLFLPPYWVRVALGLGIMGQTGESEGLRSGIKWEEEEFSNSIIS